MQLNNGEPSTIVVPSSDHTAHNETGLDATNNDEYFKISQAPDMDIHVHSNSIRTESDSDAASQKGVLNGSDLAFDKARTRTLGKLRMRPEDDHDPTDWWFASTAIPLVAATLAPMANLLSIAALVVPWRNYVTSEDPRQRYADVESYSDPRWCYNLNAISLMCGFIGNLFLLFNFTQRVRYIIALPVTIFFFYMASGILIGIIAGMNEYAPPIGNGEHSSAIYSQGFWHAIIAACLYLLNSMILMVNMLGYFLGHYPQHFTLSDEQRNLILQTMLFFIWLGGGAGVFARIEQWTYPDALYFCDVTILTIGFGDFVASNDTGRGLIFPFSVGGTIILGLMVSSLHKFARELSKEKVVRKHVEQRRVNALSRAITLEELDDGHLDTLAQGKNLSILPPSQYDKERSQLRLDELARQEQEKRRITNVQDFEQSGNTSPFRPTSSDAMSSSQFVPNQLKKVSTLHKSMRALTFPITKPISMTAQGIRMVTTRSQKKLLMIEERDRFNAMRQVQISASRFKRYYALAMSVISFGLLWCLGAMVFYFTEAKTYFGDSEKAGMNYFQGLYFCYVSLLTIGYGDLSPKSNAGKAFFVLWSLIAVPTMTILISDLGDTVIGGFKRSVLENDLGLTSTNDPRGGFSRFIQKHFRGSEDTRKGKEGKPAEPLPYTLTDSEQSPGSPATKPEVENRMVIRSIDELADEKVTNAEMIQRLASCIQRIAENMRVMPGKKYRYEEWVEFSRLIRFSKMSVSEASGISEKVDDDGIADGIVDWDWLSENSPMASNQSESEWILDRLCKSLVRVFKRKDLLNCILQSVQLDENNEAQARALGSMGLQTYTGSDLSANRKVQYSDTPHIDSAEPMSPIKRFFQGEHDNTSLKWSKRAQVRKADGGKDSRR